MKEIWREIAEFNMYQVSNIGRVKRISKEHCLKPEKDKDGYLKVRLHYRERNKKFFVHRLMAITFIPNPENKPQVNHINGIKNDNRLENLEWVTPSEQIQHAYDTGLQSAKGEKNGQSKLTQEEVYEIYVMENAGYTHQAIADKYCVSRPHITGILNGTYWNDSPDSIYDIEIKYTIRWPAVAVKKETPNLQLKEGQ